MENIGWGLQISALGMGLVFALLALLWGLLTLVLALDKAPEKHTAAQTPNAGAQGVAALTEDIAADQARQAIMTDDLPADLVAAILVATIRHKSILRRQAAPFMRSDWTGNRPSGSSWLVTGRARQNITWQPRAK